MSAALLPWMMAPAHIPGATPTAPSSTPPALAYGLLLAPCLPGRREAAHAMWLLLLPWPGEFDSPPSIH